MVDRGRGVVGSNDFGSMVVVELWTVALGRVVLWCCGEEGG